MAREARRTAGLRRAPPAPRARSSGLAAAAASSASPGPSSRRSTGRAQNQVIQGTAVVLVACFIVGVFLWVNDLIWKRVVQNLFLGQ